MNWPKPAPSAAPSRPPSLSALAAYLSAAGWAKADQDDRTSLWLRDSERSLQLVLPARQEVSDYADLIHQAMRVLSYSERRSLEEVESDIEFGPADTVSVRLAPDTPSGQAPLSLAYEAVSALRGYVIGSGAALYDRALVLPARRSRRAETYVSSARLATLPGSFILSLSLPLVDALPRSPGEYAQPVPVADTGDVQEELAGIPPQPFGRRVSNRMMSAARYAQSLAEEVGAGNQKLNVFGHANAEAPNATELEGLSGLGGVEQSPYQLRFAQSPLASQQRRPPETLRMTPGQQRIMSDAAEFLRTMQPRTDVTVEGRVVNLSRERRFGPGEAVVQGAVDDSGRDRRIHVELAEDDYNQALTAHREGRQVIVHGDLETRGTWKWMRPVKNFAVTLGLTYDDE